MDSKYSKYIKKLTLVFIVSTILAISVVVIVDNSYTNQMIHAKKHLLVNLLSSEELDKYEIITKNNLSNSELDKLLDDNGYYDIQNIKGFSDFNDSKNQSLKLVVGLVTVVNITYIIMTVLRYKSEQKRLKELNVYINKILNNDFTLDIQEFDDDSLASLKNDFYKITNKLRFLNEYSINEKKNLEVTLSDISHQLKTPLTSLFVINSVLEDDLADDVRMNFLKQNYLQLEKIEWLVKSLLKMSQIDSGSIPFSKEKVKVKDLISKSLEDHLITIELKHINLETVIDDDHEVTCDISWTSEAISNIIKNAVEHTPHAGTINISSSSNTFNTEISITDNGKGISEKDIDKIFERFFRSNNKTDGIGIGMNLSKTIMNRQDGDIRVSSVVNEGTTFKIIINK